MRIALALAAICLAVTPVAAHKHHRHYEGEIHVKAPYVDVKVNKKTKAVAVKVAKVHKATYKKHYKRKYYRPQVYGYRAYSYRPDWIPAWCGRCGVVKKMKFLSGQIKVKTRNGMAMLFEYGQQPPPSQDGHNWACTDYSLQMMPFLPIYKGTCAFKAQPVTIQPVEPYGGYKDRPIIRRY